MTYTARRDGDGNPAQDELSVVAGTRELVPTERLARLGALEAGRPAAPVRPATRGEPEGLRSPPGHAEAPAARPSLRRLLAGGVVSYLRLMDFRALDAPRLPMVVFAFSALVGGWDAQALGLVGPELRTAFGLSLTTLTALGSITSFAGLVLAIPMGYLVDHMKRVWLVRISSVLGQVSILMQVFSRSQTGYVESRLVGSAGAIVGGPAGGPLVADYFPPQVRARAFTTLGAYGQLGALVGLPIAGVLVNLYGWRAATLALAAPALVAAAGSFLLREPKRGMVDRIAAGAPLDLADVEPPRLSLASSLRAAWNIRTVRRLAFAGIPLQIGAGPLFVLLGQFYATRYQLSPAQRSVVTEIGALAALPALLFAGKLADRLLAYNPQRVVAIQGGLLFLSAFNLLVMATVPNLELVVAFGVVNSFIGAVLGPAYAAFYSLLVPAQLRGVGMQVYAPFSLIGIILGPVLVSLTANAPIQTSIMAFSPVYVLGGVLTIWAAGTVQRDLRAVRAAARADAAAAQAAGAGRRKMLVCRDLDVEYDNVQVLFNVDLDVEAGETVALIGTNGAGKSTLLGAIAGLHQASNGAIFVGGVDVTSAPAHENARNGILLLPGGRAVFPGMSVAENLRVATFGSRDEPAALAERCAEILELFPQLRARMGQQAATLSGGEQQMLALAQTFLMKPRLLMIDELSLGLAPAVVAQLLAMLRRIREDGTTILLVEQSFETAASIAERAVFMEKGEVLFDGPTRELMARPDLVRAVFLGQASGARISGARRRRAPGAGREEEHRLRVEDVAVRFGGVQAVAGASLEVEPGEIVGLIGPNGAGKTTLFDVISGYVRPDTGRVVLDGEDVTRLAPDARARAGLGRSFQLSTLFPSLTVTETIAVAFERLAAKGILQAAVWSPGARRSEARLARRVEGLVDLLGLGPYREKFVRELSTGTRRAVDLACVMAMSPRFLLLDEPSSGLAQAEAEALGPVLARLVAETGCGLLLVEHDVALVTGLAGRMVAMDLGRPIAWGTPEEVCSDPRVVAAYLGAARSQPTTPGGTEDGTHSP